MAPIPAEEWIADRVDVLRILWADYPLNPHLIRFFLTVNFDITTLRLGISNLCVFLLIAHQPPSGIGKVEGSPLFGPRRHNARKENADRG